MDTNTCVEYLRMRNVQVIARLCPEPIANMRLCSIVLAELHDGANRSADPAKNLALVQRFAARFLSLPFDDAAALLYGLKRARLER